MGGLGRDMAGQVRKIPRLGLAGQGGTKRDKCPGMSARTCRTKPNNVRKCPPPNNRTKLDPPFRGGSVVVRSALYRQGRRSCSPASPVMGLVRPPRSMNRHSQTDPADFPRHRRADRHRHPGPPGHPAKVRPACPPRPATVTARQTGTAPPCHTEGHRAASMLSSHHPTSHHAQGQPRATAVERRGMPGARGRGDPLGTFRAHPGLRARRLPIFACFFPFEKSRSLRQATAPCLVKC